MKGRLTLIALVAAAAAVAGCASTWDSRYSGSGSAYVDTGIGYYYDDLAPYGTWVNVARYGWVWCPLDTPIGWSPYTVGYWLYSDDGWFWVSQDPWGSIPYHYGRWAYDYDNGWVWVPGDTWAPAWVAWRCSNQWVGWAPLPPDVSWRVGIGLTYSAYELDDHIDRNHWCFVHARDFGTRRERVAVVPASRNVTLITRTRDVTRYDAGPRPVESGMRPELIRRGDQTPVQRYRIIDSKVPSRARDASIGDQTIEIYRPNGGVTDVVRQRVRNVPPEQRPAPSPDLVDRVEREKADLDKEVKEQRDQLSQEHDQEMKNRETGTSAVELKRRQEAELKAQRDIEEQQKRLIQQRERRILKERGATPKAAEERAKAAEKAQKARDEAQKARDEAKKVRDQKETPPPDDATKDRDKDGGDQRERGR